MDLQAVVAEREHEVALLRKALEPFAMYALTRRGQDKAVSDSEPVEVTMGMCRVAQRAMAAS